MLISHLQRLLRPVRRTPRRASVHLALERIEDRITPVTAVTIGGAPATSPEGTTINLTSTTDATTPTFAWSVVKDGASTAFATGTGSTFSFTPNDNGSYVVSLTVTDADATTVSAGNDTITVTNVPPTASLSGPSVGVRGQTLSFTLGATDPSTVDTTAGFTFNIDWNGDGTVDQTVTGPSGTVVTHTFTDESTNTVKL